MRVSDYFRRINLKLNRRYSFIEKALEKAYAEMEPGEQKALIRELNQLDVEIGFALTEARRRGRKEAWSGRLP